MPALGRHRGQVGDRVDDAVRVAGRRADDEAGAVGHRVGHGVDVGPAVGAHRDPDLLDVEVLRTPWRTPGGRCSAVTSCGSAMPRSARAWSRATWTARKMLSVPPERSSTRRWAAVPSRSARHGHDVELHLQEARVLERVERVLVQVAAADLVSSCSWSGVVGVVDEAERPAAPPVRSPSWAASLRRAPRRRGRPCAGTVAGSSPVVMADTVGGRRSSRPVAEVGRRRVRSTPSTAMRVWRARRVRSRHATVQLRGNAPTVPPRRVRRPHGHARRRRDDRGRCVGLVQGGPPGRLLAGRRPRRRQRPGRVGPARAAQHAHRDRRRSRPSPTCAWCTAPPSARRR